MEDIILKKGDIVELEDGEIFTVNGSAGTSLKDYNYFHCEKIMEVKRPVKYETIYKAPLEILDKEEKEYLSAVIKPFRNRVKFIRKACPVAPKVEYLAITVEGITKKDEKIYLPDFKPNTMYKGMKSDKEYTLEELGL